MSTDTVVRVLLSKPGLCTHETGVKLLAAGLRDAGMEVIYGGVFQEKNVIAQMALQEDVDCVGLSYLNGGHIALTRGVMDRLKEVGLGDVPVIVGGVIPADDVQPLLDLGVAGVYGPGTPIPEIAQEIRGFVAQVREPIA